MFEEFSFLFKYTHLVLSQCEDTGLTVQTMLNFEITDD